MTRAHGKQPAPGKQGMARRTRMDFAADEAGSSLAEQVLIAALAVAILGLVVLAVRR